MIAIPLSTERDPLAGKITDVRKIGYPPSDRVAFAVLPHKPYLLRAKRINKVG